MSVSAPAHAFVAKLRAQGTGFVWTKVLGGSSNDVAQKLALGADGSIYVAGTADSSDFPVTVASSTGGDFLAVLNASGSTLSYSSRYPAGSIAPALAVDTWGRVRIGGPAGVVGAFTLSGTPGTRVFGITSAAGGTLGPQMAPGEVISIYGTALGPATGVAAQPDSTGQMPRSLAGTQVTFNDTAAPLLYVSSGQINAVAPFELIEGATADIRVTTASGVSVFPGVVIQDRPTVFASGASAAAINQDGSLNSQAHPAKPGWVVSMWATGVGRTDPQPLDGQVATGAVNYHCCSLYLFDQPLEVLYGGAAPGLVAGVVQINFQVPFVLATTTVSQMPVTLQMPRGSTTMVWVEP
jgi:uncharacterized protein (TIGR03437 family)